MIKNFILIKLLFIQNCYVIVFIIINTIKVFIDVFKFHLV